MPVRVSILPHSSSQPWCDSTTATPPTRETRAGSPATGEKPGQGRNEASQGKAKLTSMKVSSFCLSSQIVAGRRGRSAPGSCWARARVLVQRLGRGLSSNLPCDAISWYGVVFGISKGHKWLEKFRIISLQTMIISSFRIHSVKKGQHLQIRSLV